MKAKNRTIVPNELHHTYQRAVNGNIVFYTSRDAIVFYTIFMTVCKESNAILLDLCIMPEHTHALIIPKDTNSISRIYNKVNNLFVREFNADCKRKGKLFEGPFGSAPKLDSKKCRTAIAYVANNPVERNMCANAEDYVWNFLAFYNNRGPFSERIVIERASRPLRRAMDEVKFYNAKNKHLNYTQLDRLMIKLNSKEKAQLRDFIISSYNAIDYERLISYYGSYDKMIMAINSNTGAEYDIMESYEGKNSDKIYRDLVKNVMKYGKFRRVKDILSLKISERISMAKSVLNMSGASYKQVKKFFHLPMEETI